MNTQKEVLDIFKYKDGVLYWKVDMHARKVKGKPCGNANKGDGRLRTQVKGKNMLNHRIIFLMHHGYLPNRIDHIDGNFLNNQIKNLRDATHSQNMCNRKINVNNTSGIKGISWDGKYWKVQIYVGGKHAFNKRFDNLELAELAAIEAREKYHGQYARYK